MSLGTWIKAERDRRDWTQQQLADRAEITPQAVSLLEKGQRENPGIKTLQGLARAFNLSVDDMLALAGLGPSSEPDELARAVAAARPYLSAELIQAIEQSGQQMPTDVRTDLARGLQAELERARRRAEFDPDASQEQTATPGGGAMAEGAMNAYAAPAYASGYEGPRGVHDTPALYNCR